MCPVACSYGQSSPTGINAQLSQVMNIPIQMLLFKNWRCKEFRALQKTCFLHWFFKRAHQKFTIWHSFTYHTTLDFSFTHSYYCFFKIFYCFGITVVPNLLLCPPPPSLPPTLINSPHTVVHVHGSFIYFLWLNPSPSFNQSSPPTSPLTAVSLYYDSMPLVLFFSLHSFYMWNHMVFVFHRLAYFT